MENNEILALWKAYDEQLEENLILNKKNAEDLTKVKIQSQLSSMRPLKWFAILVGVIWVGFVDVLIINLFEFASPFFLISAIIHVVLTKLAIGIYAYQLILIGQVDISRPILTAQEKIASLKVSTLWVAKLLFLQLPVWTTFTLTTHMLQNGNPWLLALQIVITVALTFVALWLFFNIKYENRNKKWFRLIFQGKEWTPVMQSMEMLNEIKVYKV